jgi:hypothetical protein
MWIICRTSSEYNAIGVLVISLGAFYVKTTGKDGSVIQVCICLVSKCDKVCIGRVIPDK